MSSASRPSVAISLIGPVTVRAGGEPVALTPLQEGLVAVVGSYGGSAPHSEVYRALWDSRQGAEARLRQLCTTLRAGDLALTSTRGRVTWNPDLDVVTDLDPLWQTRDSQQPPTANQLDLARRLTADGDLLFEGVGDPKRLGPYLERRRAAILRNCAEILAQPPNAGGERTEPNSRRHLVAAGLVTVTIALAGGALIAATGTDERRCTATLQASTRVSCAHADVVRQEFWRAPSGAGVHAADPATGNVYRQICTRDNSEVTCVRAEDQDRRVRFEARRPARLPVVPVATSPIAVKTWTNFRTGGGGAGPQVPPMTLVEVSCAVRGLKVPSGNVWWYRLKSRPWHGRYYASADGFYNRPGQRQGSLKNTPFIDHRAADC